MSISAQDQQQEHIFYQLAAQRIFVIPQQLQQPSLDSEASVMAYHYKLQTEPAERDKRHRVYCLLEAAGAHAQMPELVADQTVWKDLALIVGQSHDACVLNAIDRTMTAVGKESLAYSLVQPIADVEVIAVRQKVIEFLVQNNLLRTKIRTILQRLAHAENAMLSFWSDYDFFHESTKGRDSISLFGIQTLARPINRSPLALTCNSLMTHFGEFSYAALCASATVLVPWFIASRVSDEYAMPEWCEYYARCCALGGLAKGVIDHVSFKAYTALGADALEASQWISAANIGSGGILYTLSVPYAAGIAVNHLFLHKYIHAKMIAVANYVRALQDLERCVAAYTQISDTLPGAQELSQFFTTDVPASSELRQLVGLLNTATFEGEASLLCNKGRVLVAHNLTHEVKGSVARAIAAAGKIDTYLSVAELVANHTTKSVHYTMVQFEDDKQPHIQVQGLWHPMVAPHTVVTNDIELGGSSRRNVILTGPNEGGKSTFLRSMAIALMLAQTFGVAPAHAMSMTPFSSIGTYLSIEDNLADKHSTFRSEAIRAQKLVDRMSEYKKQNKLCFAVIDELFKGTAHKEGQSIAYSVSKHLGQFSNGISLIATHYKLVTLLEKTTDYFANYRMLISFDEHGGIQRLFKLEPGASTQNVALEVLASQGLAGSVIDEARLLVQQQDACEQESFLGR